MLKLTNLSILVIPITLLFFVSTALSQIERTLFVTVEGSKQGFVDDLKADNFKVFDNGAEQAISQFSVEPQPMSVGILFDVSGSVLGWGIKDLNEAAAGLQRIVTRESNLSEFFLIGFNRSPVMLTDWTSDPAVFRKALERLPNLQEGSGVNVTALHDSCIETLKKLDQGKHNKKVLILISDGIDNSMKPKLKEVFETVRGSDAIIYIVTVVERAMVPGYISGAPGSNPPLPMNATTLPYLEAGEFINQITSISGGRSFEANSTAPTRGLQIRAKDEDLELPAVFEKLLTELRSQYMIRYISSSKSLTERSHELTLKLNLPKGTKQSVGSVTIRYRKKHREI